MSKLTDIYTAMGPLLGFMITSDGNLASIGGSDIKVNGMHLKMPHRDNLNVGKMEKEKYLIYHPAHENITMDHSLIVRGALKNINNFYTMMFTTLVKNYVSLLNDSKAQEKLTPIQQAKLTGLPSVTKADVVAIGVILNHHRTMKLVNLIMRDNYSPAGSEISYKRAVTVTCPFYKTVVKTVGKKNPILGDKKLSMKFVKALADIIEHLMPWVKEPQSVYGYGTVEGGPSMRAMVQTATHLAESYNVHCEMIGESPIDTSFGKSEVFSDVTKFMTLVKTVPLQAGNQGAVDNNKPVKVETTPKEDNAIPPPVITPIPEASVAGDFTPPWEAPPAPVAQAVAPVAPVPAPVVPMAPIVQPTPAPVAPAVYTQPVYGQPAPAVIPTSNPLPATTFSPPLPPKYVTPTAPPVVPAPQLQQPPPAHAQQYTQPVYGQPAPTPPVYGQQAPVPAPYGQPQHAPSAKSQQLSNLLASRLRAPQRY